MTHSICKADGKDELQYLKGLWGTLFDSDLDVASKLERLFAAETVEFDLDYGFLSQVELDTGKYHLQVLHSPGIETNTGESVDLSETYCRRTIAAPGGSMVINDAVAEGWQDDPAYQRFGFRSYVGTTITVDQELYGTLCFADTSPRPDPITDEERSLVGLHGQWASHALNQWGESPDYDAVDEPIDVVDVSSPRIDTMMNVLENRTRRLLLYELLDDATEVSVDTLDRMGTDDAIRTELHHTHLPKLEEAGYVEWDRDAETMYRGPRFFEVEPAFELLQAYRTKVGD